MKYPSILQSAVVALAVCGAAAFAQTMPTPAVMTDTAPLPAQDRSSAGAIVLEDSMVLAQREAFRQAGARTGVATIGRNAMRATMRQQTIQDLAEMRAQEAARFRDGGAAAQDEK
ncbi:MAG: hypothetical protein HY854_20935 [Burkholderiales bacterium]|nr:hypothetical protein [Burkholderiales bacterium]